MKRLRRYGVICAALFLGVIAWLLVLLSGHTEAELRLARQLGSGQLVARVPTPTSRVPGIKFGPATLSVRLVREKEGLEVRSPLLPRGTVWISPRTDWEEELWHINLDPLDKTWEIEIIETRSVILRAGSKRLHLGSKTRTWRTNRRTENADLE